LADAGPYPLIMQDEVSARFPGLRMRALRFTAKVREEGYPFGQQLEEARRRLSLTPSSLKDHPIIRAYRDFYWRLGIDPTKQRPSSEGLARRLLAQGRLPRINSVVDAGNIASAETLIAIGLYDLDEVRGVPLLRWARRGEQFEDITGKRFSLGENNIVLADELGIIHVFPYRDSFRTRIKGSTQRVLAVACGVPGIGEEHLERALARVVELVRLFGS
jgi:DNA/RNA-binding domain of Phe-tRNA-synthetase-like protein